MSLINLSTHTNLPPVGKEYMCFQIDVESSQASKCVKSRIMTNVIDCVLLNDTFEQQCVVLKGMLQFPCLKYSMETIVIHQSLSNSALFEHICLKNTKKLYKPSAKNDDQQQLKDILVAAMVSAPEVFTYNTPIYPMTPPTLKKLSARKSFCIFTNISDTKKKTAIRQVGDAISERKAINSGTTP